MDATGFFATGAAFLITGFFATGAAFLITGFFATGVAFLTTGFGAGVAGVDVSKRPARLKVGRGFTGFSAICGGGSCLGGATFGAGVTASALGATGFGFAFSGVPKKEARFSVGLGLETFAFGVSTTGVSTFGVAATLLGTAGGGVGSRATVCFPSEILACISSHSSALARAISPASSWMARALAILEASFLVASKFAAMTSASRAAAAFSISFA